MHNQVNHWDSDVSVHEPNRYIEYCRGHCCRWDSNFLVYAPGGRQHVPVWELMPQWCHVCATGVPCVCTGAQPLIILGRAIRKHKREHVVQSVTWDTWRCAMELMHPGGEKLPFRRCTDTIRTRLCPDREWERATVVHIVQCFGSQCGPRFMAPAGTVCSRVYAGPAMTPHGTCVSACCAMLAPLYMAPAGTVGL